MKPFRWNAEKNESLTAERGMSFERVVVSVESGGLLDMTDHPNQARYPRQKVMIVAIDSYAYLVPYVEEDNYYFLKTVIPSRKATREKLIKGDPNAET
ncbi:MAG: toxin [Proteobacteria bacterium]|nr:toxin [Pseudomonadota bacterium]